MDRIVDLWQDMVAALIERYSFLTDRDMTPTGNDPANEAVLDALARHWGFALPPSYAAFLRLFNGTTNFVYETALLSVEEVIAGEQWVVVDELDEGLVPYVFVASHDTDLFCAFDPKMPVHGNELGIVVFTSGGVVEKHDDLVSFLGAYLDALRSGIATERADRLHVR